MFLYTIVHREGFRHCCAGGRNAAVRSALKTVSVENQPPGPARGPADNRLEHLLGAIAGSVWPVRPVAHSWQAVCGLPHDSVVWLAMAQQARRGLRTLRVFRKG